MIGRTIGPYRIVDSLGEGGMGEVYRAEDTRLNRTVAIKILPADVANDAVRRERFDREARTIATLTHPHICTLYDVGHQDGVDFLVLEHLEGETLEARLRAGPLAAEQTLRYGIELADALDQAHRRGIVHRDLKPANIIVTSAGVKLLDFGLAQWRQREALSFERGGSGDTTSLTAEGTILGTLQYMSPEQIEGRGNDQRADLFALGAVLYEMATGEKGFRGDSPAGQMAAVLTSEPPPVSTVRPDGGFPRAFDHLVQRCLAKDPEARWQSARDVMLELTWMARAAPSADIHPKGVARHWLRGRTGWAVAGLLAGVSVALGVVAVLQNNRVRETLAKSTPVKPYVFTVAAPDNAALSPDAYLMALSPDGRRLAFVASLGGGRPFLWIRSLVESTPMRPLLHTEGAAAPFWSPDSESIAFVADGKLKKIHVDSETMMVLADDASPFPGAWGQEGIILFSNSGHDIFYKVSVEGGPVKPATALNRTRKEVAHQGAHFLPDGRRFLFVADGTPSLVLASVDSTDRIRTIPVESFDTRYVEPGYLLWHRGSALYARPFDLFTFQSTGPPSAIAEHVRYHRGTDAGVYSASSTGLAYREVQTTRLAWFDRRGKQIGLIGQPGTYSDLALSPDGKRLAVCQFDQDAGRRDIWLYDIEGSKWSRLTSNPADDIWPTWSSDSRRILFASNRNGYFDLFVRTIEPAAEDQLVEGIPPQPHKWPIDWTPEGLLLYRDGMAMKASILPPGGKPADAPPRLAEAGISDKLSPDGRWLAFTAGWTSGAGIDLYVAPFPAGDKTWRISSGGGAQPRWRRDGKQLFYLARDGRLMAVQVDTTHGFHAGQPQPLFQTTLPFTAKNAPESRNTYSVTPDGQRFLLNEPVGGDTPITVLLNWTAKLPR